jgi:hypothetical protein
LFNGFVDYGLFYPSSSEEKLRCQPKSDRKVSREFVALDGPSDLAQIWLRVQPRTKVPLKLPTYVATHSEAHPLYAIIESASPSAYRIQLAFTHDCAGGNACHYGVVTGRTLRPRERRPKGKPVPLTDGLIGYFVDATCGAVCSDSTLTWNEGAFHYTVGLKAEKFDALKKVAESAIK